MSMEMQIKARGSNEKEANTKLHKQATAIMRRKGYRDYYTTDPVWKQDELFGGGEKSARVVFTDKGEQVMKVNMKKIVKDMDTFKRAVIKAAVLKAKGKSPKQIATALEEEHGFTPAVARAAVWKVVDRKAKDALAYLSDKAQQLADYLRMQGKVDVKVLCRKLKVDEDRLMNLIAEVNKNSDKIRIKGDPLVDKVLSMVKIKDEITSSLEEAIAMQIFRALKKREIDNPNKFSKLSVYEEKYGAPVVRTAIRRALELAKLNKVAVKDNRRAKVLAFIRDCKKTLIYKDADIRHLTRKEFREKWDKGVFAGKLTPEALQKGKWMGTYKASKEPVTVVFKDASTTDKQIQAAAQEAWDAGSEDAWQMLDDEGGDGVPMQKFLNGMKQQLTHCVTSRARMAADSEGFDSKDTSKVVAAATTIMNKNMGKFLKECRDYYE